MQSICTLHWGRKKVKFQPQIAICSFSINRIFNQAQYFGIAIYDRGFNLNIRIAKKSQQPADQLAMPGIFGQVPWFHHVIIISKVVVRALGDITEDGVKSIKLLYICCKTARIGVRFALSLLRKARIGVRFALSLLRI